MKPIIKSTPFHNLSAIDKRKAIGKDVLRRLKKGQITPAHIGYLRIDDIPSANVDLQKLIHKEKHCLVCAVGGAIVALAHFEDNINVDNFGKVNIMIDKDIDDREQYKKNKAINHRLRKILGIKLMALIEVAYEGFKMDEASGLKIERSHLSTNQYNAALGFYMENSTRFYDSEVRFKKIWTEIARTGTFNPIPTTS